MEGQSVSLPINTIRDESIVTHFAKQIGRRIFVLTEAFPFMFIGKIEKVIEDMVILDVERTSVPALEGKKWTIHIHSIEVFYIETGLGPKIPDLQD